MSFVTGFCQNTKQGCMDDGILFVYFYILWMDPNSFVSQNYLGYTEQLMFLFYPFIWFCESFQLHQENVYGFRAIAQAAGKTLSFGGDEEGNNAQYVLFSSYC